MDERNANQNVLYGQSNPYEQNVYVNAGDGMGNSNADSGMEIRRAETCNSGYHSPYGSNPYENYVKSYKNYACSQSSGSVKNSKASGIILLAVGLLLAMGGLGTIFLGAILETEEPVAVDVCLAEKTNQYVYTQVQYLTEAVAYYDHMEDMQFYIAFDREWNPAVICFDSDELETFEPYIDWLYSDSYENEPRATKAVGYSRSFDRELKKLVIEGYEENFGEGYVDMSNFEDCFGEYYIQVGGKSGFFDSFDAGMLILAAGIAVTYIGIIVLIKITDRQPHPAEINRKI